MSSTVRLRADVPGDLQRAAEMLRAGERVAFPTETVYGLGANAFSPEAVAGIFHAKARPSWDPLIVHLASPAQVSLVADVRDPALQRRVKVLSNGLWPGPLTLLLPRVNAIPDAVTAGRPLVGVRIPVHPVARALLATAALPIAAPSANRFGHVSPTTAQHVLDDLDGRIEAVLDGGACPVGVESTVLDPTQTPMVLYRAGAVTPERLQALTGERVHIFEPLALDEASNPIALPSPGVGLRHYAPRVPVHLTEPTAAALGLNLTKALETTPGSVAVLLPGGWALPAQERVVAVPWGDWQQPDTLAAELFAALRQAEGQGVSLVVCPLPEPGGLRDALRDRLQKAARRS